MDPVIASGELAPSFSLPDLTGNQHTLEEQRGQIVILNFWSCECPWAERADCDLLAWLPVWGTGVHLWTIAANANEPPDRLAQVAAQRGLPLVLHDSHQVVADRYGAQTTPHLYVIDRAGILCYQGAFDDVTFRQRQPTRNYLRQAMDVLLAGQAPQPAQTSPYGCTIVRYPQTA
jgi:peroxiredoxin